MLSKKSPVKLLPSIARMLDDAANPFQNFPRYIIQPNKKSIIIIKKNQIRFTHTTYQVNLPPKAPACLTAQRIPNNNSHKRSDKTFQNKKLYVYTINDNNKHRFSQYWLVLTKSINKVIYIQKCAFCQKYKIFLLL